MTKFRVFSMIVAVPLVVLLGGCCDDDDTLGLFSSGGSGGGGGGGVPLNTAGAFAILAGSTITNTGATMVTGGDIAVNGPSVTGFPPGTASGAIYTNPPDVAIVTQAQSDLTTAYNDAAGRTTGAITIAGDLGGLTLAPGLYKSTSTLAITGTLTLDALGDSGAAFIFQVASGLTTATGSQIILSGGAQAQNIYWQVGSSAVLGTNSVFKGIIMADQSITIASGATLEGRALARIGQVSLDTNIIAVP
jgi:hypothetical protein